MPIPFAFWKSSASNDAFQLVIKTDNAGTSNDDQFTLPLKLGQTYNCVIDWGDGETTEQTTTTSPTHTYAEGAGTYTVSVTGVFPTIYFNNGGDCLKVLQLSNWGTQAWTTFAGSFWGCANMVITATDHATANTSSVTDMYTAFFGCSSLTSFPLLDTSSVTSMGLAWYNCSGLTSFPILDTSSVTDMGYAWFGCSGLTSFPLLDTSSVTDIQRAWLSCTGLNGYDFPTLPLSAITNGTLAFHGVTLSAQSWSDLLVYIEANNTDPDCVLSGGNSKHNAAGAAAITALEGRTPGWTITDGGLAA